MVIPRKQAVVAGVIAIACVLALQAFNSIGCYEHTLVTFVQVLGMFLLVPLLPALMSLFTRRPPAFSSGTIWSPGLL